MACAKCGGDHKTPEGADPDLPFILRTSGDAMLFLSQNPVVAESFSKWIQDTGKLDIDLMRYDREMFLTNLAIVYDWAHAYADEIEKTKKLITIFSDVVRKEEELNDAPITEYMEDDPK